MGILPQRWGDRGEKRLSGEDPKINLAVLLSAGRPGPQRLSLCGYWPAVLVGLSVCCDCCCFSGGLTVSPSSELPWETETAKLRVDNTGMENSAVQRASETLPEGDSRVCVGVCGAG